MPHLRSVDNGTFLLLKEGFMAKITKIQELPGASHPGPHVGLKATPKPHAFEKKNPPPPPKKKKKTKIPGTSPFCEFLHF